MSLHIAAKQGDIAKKVFITGDPLRAKYYAERWLENAFCYNHIRGMLGYTGTYRGDRISIQGTGIGIPSTALYLHELIYSYQVDFVLRLGTCGAIQHSLKLGDIIAATEAYTDSPVISTFIEKRDYPPRATSSLLMAAEKNSSRLSLDLKKGALFSTDLFYHEDDRCYDEWMQQGVLGVDMETSLLYAMASRYKIQSLALLTVSDHLRTRVALSAEHREKHADDMIRLALQVASSIN